MNNLDGLAENLFLADRHVSILSVVGRVVSSWHFERARSWRTLLSVVLHLGLVFNWASHRTVLVLVCVHKK